MKISRLLRHEKIILTLLLFLVYSILCRYLVSITDNGRYLGYMLILEAGIVIPLLFYVKKYSIFLLKNSSDWMKLCCVILFFELINALIFLEHYDYVIQDAVFWLFFFSLFLLGANQHFWDYFIPCCVMVLIVFSLLSLLEIVTGNFDYMMFRGGVVEGSYLYDIQAAFAPAGMVTTYYILSNRRKETIAMLFVFFFYFILQFFFQKRLPLLRVLLCVIFMLYTIRTMFPIKKSIGIVFVLIISSIVAFIFIPKDFYDATINRFFQGGTLSETAQSDGRYLIAEKAMALTFDNVRSLLFGQGLGGYIEGDFWGKSIILSGRTVEGISEIEVGAVTILLKYGILFLFLLYGYMASLIFKYKSIRKDALSQACWAYLAVSFIMSIVGESFPGVATPFSTALLAASMGYLSSKNSRIMKSDYVNV